MPTELGERYRAEALLRFALEVTPRPPASTTHASCDLIAGLYTYLDLSSRSVAHLPERGIALVHEVTARLRETPGIAGFPCAPHEGLKLDKLRKGRYHLEAGLGRDLLAEIAAVSRLAGPIQGS